MATEIIAESDNTSKDTVKRYIRLTNLIPPILDMVDEKRIAFTPAVELSYLLPEEQIMLLSEMEYSDCTPNLSQAQRLKALSMKGLYAIRELSLDDDYTFINYEDKGLSGYYSDRPDFQRMLHDIEMGKIRAVVCYKLDRIGRKASDLLRLLDFLEKHKVDLLICSNNINTASGVSKIFIQIFAVVAEFERYPYRAYYG